MCEGGLEISPATSLLNGVYPFPFLHPWLPLHAPLADVRTPPRVPAPTPRLPTCSQQFLYVKDARFLDLLFVHVSQKIIHRSMHIPRLSSLPPPAEPRLLLLPTAVPSSPALLPAADPPLLLPAIPVPGCSSSSPPSPPPTLQPSSAPDGKSMALARARLHSACGAPSRPDPAGRRSSTPPRGRIRRRRPQIGRWRRGSSGGGRGWSWAGVRARGRRVARSTALGARPRPGTRHGWR